MSLEKKKKTIVLGLETSCDDTCVAILSIEGNKVTVLANLVWNQNNLHEGYGGVVPEIAARAHLNRLPEALDEALNLANLTMEEIDLIGCTENPGLISSLLIGINFSKGLALSYKVPLIFVNHVEAHLTVNFMNKEVKFPLLGLVISGGHTELWRLNSFKDYRILESTSDDAVGEVFDKVGRVLGLPFPGGVHVENLGKKAQSIIEIKLPKILSFSGLKTKFLELIKEGVDKHVLCATLEEVCGNMLVRSIKKHKNSNEELIVGGGVSANGAIRKKIKDNFNGSFVDKEYCTDNGVMIGFNAYLKYLNK